MITAIIEIILVIFAWQKGWKWYSLIPVAIAYSIAALLGAALGAAGAANVIGSAPVVFFILIMELCAIGVLIYMVTHPRITKPLQSGT
jgi:hypothetical protein